MSRLKQKFNRYITTLAILVFDMSNIQAEIMFCDFLNIVWTGCCEEKYNIWCSLI